MSKIVLRDYQVHAAGTPFEYFRQGNTGNPLIALPTGTGKSLVLAEIVRRILGAWSDQRILLLTHVKELIIQDLAALHDLWPEAPSAVYSASLNQRRINNITFGGIATVSRRADLFKGTNIVLIDEAHLVSPKGNTMYRALIDTLIEYNPNLKVIGTTATIYRLGQGLLTEGDDRLFTHTCCDLTGLDAFNWFIQEGYLCSLIPRPMKTEFDLEGVRTLAGEYNARDLAEAVDLNEVTECCCEEIIEYGKTRNSWLIFATSIKHAEHIGQYLMNKGIRTGIVHSKMPDMQRDLVISKFKTGEFKAVVNQNILTTGFDHPGMDMIAVMRPTKSTSLWVQMLGRGTRPFPGKQNCLVLDFARNTERLGPINDPVLPIAKGKNKGGSAPIRECPECHTYNHASVRFCINCGYEFPRGVHIYTNSGTDALIAPPTYVEPEYATVAVKNVTYKIHSKNGFDSLKVSYFCELNKFDEYIHFERPGGLRAKAVKWFNQRIVGSRASGVTDWVVPAKTVDLLELYGDDFKAPKWIRVQTNLKYAEIKEYGFNDRRDDIPQECIG